MTQRFRKQAPRRGEKKPNPTQAPTDGNADPIVNE